MIFSLVKMAMGLNGLTNLKHKKMKKESLFENETPMVDVLEVSLDDLDNLLGLLLGSHESSEEKVHQHDKPNEHIKPKTTGKECPCRKDLHEISMKLDVIYRNIKAISQKIDYLLSND